MNPGKKRKTRGQAGISAERRRKFGREVLRPSSISIIPHGVKRSNAVALALNLFAPANWKDEAE